MRRSGRRHFRSRALENDPQQAQRVFLVVNGKDVHAFQPIRQTVCLGAGFQRPGCPFRAGRLAVNNRRQAHSQGRAGARPVARRGGASAMQLDELADNRQSEPQPAVLA